MEQNRGTIILIHVFQNSQLMYSVPCLHTLMLCIYPTVPHSIQKDTVYMYYAGR